jgi:hypothetical protein
MKKHIPLLIIVILLLMTACAHNRATAIVSPGVDMSKIKSFHIIEESGDKGTNNIYKLIESNLTKREYSVTTGPDMQQSSNKSDVIIIYDDKWVWDMRMYLLNLTITFKESTNNLTMASGNSHHTSLTRKSPEEMVDEVLTNIFRTKPNGQMEKYE